MANCGEVLYMDVLSENESDSNDENNDHEFVSEESGSESDVDNDEILIKASNWEKNAINQRQHFFQCPHPLTEFNYKNLNTNSSSLAFVKHFLTSEILDEWVLETNRYVTQVRTKRKTTFRNWNDVNDDDLWVFIGISTLMGIDKKPAVRDYWSTDRLLYSPIYGETMTRDRFMNILSAFHLVNNESYNAIKENRLIKLGNFFPNIMNAFRETIVPGEYLSADETLMSFKGRLAFKQYIPSKRSRFGVKFFMLVDAETKFVIKMIPYTGKSTGISQQLIKEYGYGGAVILTLMQDYLDTCRIVVMDNYFTSPILAQELQKRKTHLLGTVRKHRKEMPIMTNKIKQGEAESYTQHGLTVVRWMDNREVVTLDSFIDHGMKESSSTLRNPTREFKRKPISVLRYNETMGGVDDVDRQLAPYALERKTCKWYRKVAFHIVSICIYNAYVLYNSLRPPSDKKPYRDFIMQVIRDIFENHKVQNSRKKKMQVNPADDCRQVNTLHLPIENSKRSRCQVCHTRATWYSCGTCLKKLCIRSDKNCYAEYHTLGYIPRKKKIKITEDFEDSSDSE